MSNVCCPTCGVPTPSPNSTATHTTCSSCGGVIPLISRLDQLCVNLPVFLVKRNEWSHEEDVSHIVAAESEQQARQLCYDMSTLWYQEEYRSEWLDPEKSTIETVDLTKDRVLHTHTQ